MVALSSTASLSCAAVTVTICGVLQFVVVNVRADETVTSLLPLDGVTVTDTVGSLSSFTV